ncbi:MAG: biotin carboxylase [Actinomycetota bacterium]|nr:biotin carboxylase [Actinomycetota bacterium]
MTYNVVAEVSGTISELRVVPSSVVTEAAIICYIESMKMEYEVRSDASGLIVNINVKLGSQVSVGDTICTIETNDATVPSDQQSQEENHLPRFEDLDKRNELYFSQSKRLRQDRRSGEPTALERIGLLFDEGSFEEYGRFAIAAQRRRRNYNDLVARTQNDGVITGIGTIGGAPAATICYDYDVLAGTQGIQNHRKLDRILEIIARRRLPLITFADGGGGRPGDTDGFVPTGLEVSSFAEIAKLSQNIPHIAIASGYTFAGNAALAAVADVIIGVDGLSMGMGGPAMIEGAGLGSFHPSEVGPIDVHEESGTIDIRVPDIDSAIKLCKTILDLASNNVKPSSEPIANVDLDLIVPQKRGRTFDLDSVINGVSDGKTTIELKPKYGKNLRVFMARIEGFSAIIIANDSRHFAGAIDKDASEKAIFAYKLADKFNLPIVSLIDTPGFVVGPHEESRGGVRSFGQLFIEGSRCKSETIAIVLRRGYGLGAMAMTKGSFKETFKTISWPTGEFGGMGPEGAIRLGNRKELEAIADLAQREERYNQLLQALLNSTSALSLADAFEIDEVIKPNDTRSCLKRLFEQISLSNQ